MSSIPRVPLAIVVAVGVGCAPAATSMAQALNDTGMSLEFDDPTQSDLPRRDEQNVQPARLRLLAAVRQLQIDRQAKDADAVPADELVVIDARRALIEAQLLADQTRLPQAPPDAQADLQARDQVLRAEEAVGEAQRKLIGDRQAKDTAALHDDLAAVQAARAQSQKARQQWEQSRAQFRALQPPIDSK